MDERLKETLSAMMDDQADELSVRRLLSHGDHEEVRGQWQRWQQVRELMHGTTPSSVDISHRVRDSLDGTRASVPPAPSRNISAAAAQTWPRRSWSVVATVAMALAVGFGAGAGWQTSEESVPVMAGAPAAISSQSADVPEVALQGLDEAQREHLSRYLLEHAQHNSIGAGGGSVGYARLVSVAGPSGPGY
ncbi:sigma-E factor negative regulatory protein [Marinobacter sp.]|uniref:sigma-E factor negative regulatory protein n=1 Tax=Marinobacter sp. TaxID=50741 RepID=UPI00384C2F2C